jgi:hypothetical protein
MWLSGGGAEANESREKVVDAEEEEIQMLSQYLTLVLNLFGGMSKHFNGKWLSTQRSLSQLARLEVN